MNRNNPETRYYVEEHETRSEVRDRVNPGRGVLSHFSEDRNGPLYRQMAAEEAALMNQLEDLARDGFAYRDCQSIENGGRGC